MSNQSQLSTFNFESNSIRTLAINNEPWFVAVDICRALNLSSPSMAIANLDDDEKYTLSLTEGIEGVGKQVQELNLVSESGMYTLILRCRDAVKKGSIPHRFRKWVTAEVLPTIRKTGKYESKTSVNDRTGLRNAVNMLVSKKGLIYSEAYHLVHQRFNVESIEDLTLEQLPEAVEYVHKIILEGELITEAELPSREKKFSFEFTEFELETLVWLWFGHKQMNTLLGQLEKPLDVIGSNLHPAVYSYWKEYGQQHKDALATMRRLVKPFIESNRITWQRVINHIQ
ncbi:phage repressor protein/antirepressor Ant [Haemophilus influenzae]|uniref:P22AR C-terminal domain-containing protein n=1 Tax=Haemophilus influenzae TaxID=727 RepID=UPI000E3560C1|nr:P22AR C-terminal domain-containing protein [Haemophilus influenzae]MCK8932438.1 phage repressor protein/antirepressor Ant [Haemophilus influenzae]RFO65902.1 phage repressor protein/antirepressor Ant [Haemophilus influenzae]RFO70117.1 phage repressor protein/antirepressor Ant [Haemophilus influenzae]